ncbi:hypothetical protein TrRE_jg9946 [Triparma retinervis]|uniref:Uncharacterized protein n=1 Tax=Triparma retinervis TaxID=2557542 RepID=A0A9W7ECG2_9STRA|nr:hypothetical protein TrRE_jg9946 [Triparma retinervis]
MSRAVLDEDTYVEALDDVIRRDYYPSTRNEDDKKGTRGRRNEGGDRGEFYDNYGDGGGYGYGLDDCSEEEDESNHQMSAKKADNLTDFHRKNTSEDNEYFHKQHQSDLDAHRERYAYAYAEGAPLLLMPDGTKQTKEKLALMEATPLASDEFDLKPKGMAETWKYRAKNALFGTPGSLDKNRDICGLKPKGLLMLEGGEGQGGENEDPYDPDRAAMPPPARTEPFIQPSATRFGDSALLNQFLRDAKDRGGGGGSRYEGSHTTSEYDSGSEMGGDGRRKINGYSFVSMEGNGTPKVYPTLESIPKTVGVPSFGLMEESRRDKTGRRLADDVKKKAVARRKQSSSSSSSSRWGRKIASRTSGRTPDPTANLTPAAMSLLSRTAGGKARLIGGLPNPNATPRDGGSLGGELRRSYNTPRSSGGVKKRGDYTPRRR